MGKMGDMRTPKIETRRSFRCMGRPCMALAWIRGGGMIDRGGALASGQFGASFSGNAAVRTGKQKRWWGKMSVNEDFIGKRFLA